MRRGLDYLRGMVNGTVGLLRASGSLFIDVFDRHGTHATFRTSEIVDCVKDSIGKRCERCFSCWQDKFAAHAHTAMKTSMLDVVVCVWLLRSVS